MILLQGIVCFAATISFAVLFAAPKSELAFCGIAGAVAWICYLTSIDLGFTSVFSNLLACFCLTLTSRIFAATRKTPVTVYLIPGIFPLVPGAGIYYTSYSLIMNDIASFSSNGASTLKTAGALVLGIIFGTALPQKWFNALQKVTSKKDD